MRIIKVLSIVCLLCLFVPCESIAHTHMHSHASHSAWTAPSVSMRSTSAMRTTTTTSSSGWRNESKVSGFYTSASAISGGMTTSSYSPAAACGPRRIGMPDMPEIECSCCIDENDDHICDRCGHSMFINESGECGCHDESGYCWCPIGDGWQVWLFMAVMATGYADFVRRRRVKSEFSRKKCG